MFFWSHITSFMSYNLNFLATLSPFWALQRLRQSMSHAWSRCHKWQNTLAQIPYQILQGLKIWISSFLQGWNEITSGFLARPDTSLDFVLTTFEGGVGMKSWQVPVVPNVPLAMYLPAIQPSVGNRSGQPCCYGEGDTQPHTDCWSKIQTEDCRPADVYQF